MNNINHIIEVESQRFADDISGFTLTEMGELLKSLASGIVAHGNAVSAAHFVKDTPSANNHILSASANLLTIAGVARAMHERIVELCTKEGVEIHISHDSNNKLTIHTTAIPPADNSVKTDNTPESSNQESENQQSGNEDDKFTTTRTARRHDGNTVEHRIRTYKQDK